MDNYDAKHAVAKEYGVKAGTYKTTVNKAIRTMAGGEQTIEAITYFNNLRNKIMKRGDNFHLTDSMIDALETIRQDMENEVLIQSNVVK